jgi:hypothetical protein
MATFLTNNKMSPELAARIEASVTGRTPTRRRSSTRARRTALLRLAGVAAVITVVGGSAFAWERAVADRESARDALLDAVGREANGVTAEELDAPARIEAVLLELGGSYAGDSVPDAVRAPGGLRKLLAQPAVYLRGPIQSFRSASGIREVAPESGKDSFLSCLLDPPPSKEERALFERVQAVRAGERAVAEPMRHVRRLRDALVGLPFLSPAWVERVHDADSILDIAELHRTFARAPVREALEAARAKVIIVVQDEAKVPGTVTELDGATVHDVRLGIYDARTGDVRLRVKRRSDPEWVSERRRPHHSREIEDCRMARAVREELG